MSPGTNRSWGGKLSLESWIPETRWHAAPYARARGSGWARAANPITLSSCPSDLAASGNDEGALTARGGGEGEPHGQSPDTLLGNTDKELNAGAAVTSCSAGAAPVASCQREPGDLVMEPGLWGTCLGKANETPFPKKRWTMERSLGSLERNICPSRSGIVWSTAREKGTALCHSQPTCGRPLPLAGLRDQLPKNWDPPPVSPQLSSAL